MNLPFVSRGRFEDAQARIAQLEADNKRLTELLIPALRPAEQKPEPIVLSENSDMSKITPMNRPTVASVIFGANQEAMKRAKVPGSQPLSREVFEREITPWRQASGN